MGITGKHKDHDNGDVPTVEGLMTAAKTKYNQLKQGSQWKAKSPEEKEIIALQVSIQDTGAKLVQITKKGGNNSGNKKSSLRKDDGTSKSSKKKADYMDKSKGEQCYLDWHYECKENQDKLEKGAGTILLV